MTVLDFSAAYAKRHGEPWLTKQEIARHVGFSARWVELRVKHDGMPHLRIGGRLRFQKGPVDAWMIEYGKAA